VSSLLLQASLLLLVFLLLPASLRLLGPAYGCIARILLEDFSVASGTLRFEGFPDEAVVLTAAVECRVAGVLLFLPTLLLSMFLLLLVPLLYFFYGVSVVTYVPDVAGISAVSSTRAVADTRKN
jgi:hypothetical protein